MGMEYMNNGVCMSDNVTYDVIWQVLRREKQTNELLAIPKSFYADVSAFIDSIDKNHNEENDQLRANTVKLVTEMYEKRKQKILIYTALGRALPSSLPAEETSFYNDVMERFKSSQFTYTRHGDANKTTLESLLDMPEILLPSGSRVGPLVKNQYLTVDNEDDAAFLVSNALCKKVG